MARASRLQRWNPLALLLGCRFGIRLGVRFARALSISAMLFGARESLDDWGG